MCYAKIDGGYRCMPSQRLLKAYRGLPVDAFMPRQANGAFWLNPMERIPDIREIEESVYALRDTSFLIEDDSVLEAEVSHVGNMIARYSDSQVVDFDRRLKDAQEAGIKYREASYSAISPVNLEKLREKTINLNLALSYESRHYLQETLKKISVHGHPMSVDIEDSQINPKYRQSFVEALRRASTAYPSAWNNALDDKLLLTYAGANESSTFSRFINEVTISDKSGGFVSYSSLDDARKAKAKDVLGYRMHIDMVHELAHKFEFVQPEIVRVSRSFLRRRSVTGPDIDFNGYNKVRDHFTWDYAGQLWGNRHTEVFSVGMESSILGTQGSAIGLALPVTANSSVIRNFRPDVEHRNLTLGILATTVIPFNNDIGYEDAKPGQEESDIRKKVQTMFGEVNPFDFK